MHSKEEIMNSFSRFLDVLDELREKCPWDRKQTMQSLRPNTLEEVYELSDAVMSDNREDICKESGDVLLHVAFYAKIASETGEFDFKDVCDRLCDKLIYRHPHVFGDVQAETAGEVCRNWELLKLKEKGGNKSLLSGVPTSLPSLIKAYRVGEKAANAGFDWEKPSDVWNKVQEELAELKCEIEKGDRAASEKELGDYMFSLVNMARLYHLNPDTALEYTNRKFISRFNYIEKRAADMGKTLKEMTLAEMDVLWCEAKEKE